MKLEVFPPVGSGTSARLFDGNTYVGSIGNSDWSTAESAEFAAFIVRAVNAHDRLVQALKCIAKFGEEEGSPFGLSVAKTARNALLAELEGGK